MEKDFIKGKVVIKEFANGGKIFKVWIPKDEVERVIKDNGINFEIKFAKESGLPYMENDTWRPEKKNGKKNEEDKIDLNEIF